MTMTTNPDESKDRIERAYKFYEPEPNWRSEHYAKEFARLAADFAAAENQLLSTRVEELNKWRIAFESLTPMGSEWVNDLPKCEDYIRQRMMSGQKAEMKLVHANRRVEELEKENAKYREALEHYADETNWHYVGRDFGGHYDKYLGEGNGYDLARSALTEKHDTAAGEGE